jgi:uncharacterized surface protein with fasciclin (FAS1) repeats
MRNTIIASISAMAMLALVGCSSDSSTPMSADLGASSSRSAGQSEDRPAATIYDIAKAASEADTPQFTILVAALEATGLDAALDGKGQFTVFAPTDDAFAKLFANPDFPFTPEELLANTELLSTVLLYHVARGNRQSGDVVTSEQIRMMNGGFNDVEVNGGAFLRDASDLTEDAEIVTVDILARNGVIHVIDEVLLP